MSIVLNLANRLYVSQEEFQGTVVYKISSDGNEVFCNEDESFQYRMNPEVYRLILEQLGAHTYYYQAGYQEVEVSFKEYEQTYLSFEEEDVFADSYFYELNQAIEAAQFLFEVFVISGGSVGCEFGIYDFNRQMAWKDIGFLTSVDGSGRIDEAILVVIPYEKIQDSTLYFEAKIKNMGGATINYQEDVVELRVASLTQAFLMVANLI